MERARVFAIVAVAMFGMFFAAVGVGLLEALLGVVYDSTTAGLVLLALAGAIGAALTGLVGRLRGVRLVGLTTLGVIGAALWSVVQVYGVGAKAWDGADLQAWALLVAAAVVTVTALFLAPDVRSTPGGVDVALTITAGPWLLLLLVFALSGTLDNRVQGTQTPATILTGLAMVGAITGTAARKLATPGWKGLLVGLGAGLIGPAGLLGCDLAGLDLIAGKPDLPTAALAVIVLAVGFASWPALPKGRSEARRARLPIVVAAVIFTPPVAALAVAWTAMGIANNFLVGWKLGITDEFVWGIQAVGGGLVAALTVGVLAGLRDRRLLGVSVAGLATVATYLVIQSLGWENREFAYLAALWGSTSVVVGLCTFMMLRLPSRSEPGAGVRNSTENTSSAA